MLIYLVCYHICVFGALFSCGLIDSCIAVDCLVLRLVTEVTYYVKCDDYLCNLIVKWVPRSHDNGGVLRPTPGAQVNDEYRNQNSQVHM